MPATLQTMRSGATAHPEEIVAFLLSRFIETSGVFDKVGDSFLITEQASPDMTVLVTEGYGFISKSDGSMCYPVRLYDGDDSVTIGANASGNPRIDAIVLYIDLAASPDSTATNVATLAAVAGTPAASPAAPSDAAIQSDIGASNPFIRLANVTVASGASTIEDADIEDTRTSAKVNDGFDFSDAIKFLLVDASAANEFDYSGVTQNLQAGETFAFGEVGYMKSDGKVWKGDADAESTAPAICMALGAIAGDATGLFILLGTVKNASWSFTVGGKVYLSNTTGAITQTQPTGTDDVIQVLGVAVAADRIFFNPALNYVVHI